MVRPDSSCYAWWGRYMNNNSFCTYPLDNGYAQGDTGGPFMYKNPIGFWQDVGIAAALDYSAKGIFVKTALYVKNFIKDNTGGALWCDVPEE
ncbi:unnamed protein product [Darwinula stevensoni]|uniref:Uncharacterized protein n=1 Tax=Darwinula stevensoni TaxID=69355 RepID=A0A7R9AIV8_9CRUS|nr:unnamed protein product [Darwinula stevensoni]CAG0906432.1 unnamed protein product [Darwinula stevensoni]